jgi:hypothetical protein
MTQDPDGTAIKVAGHFVHCAIGPAAAPQVWAAGSGGRVAALA